MLSKRTKLSHISRTIRNYDGSNVITCYFKYVRRVVIKYYWEVWNIGIGTKDLIN